MKSVDPILMYVHIYILYFVGSSFGKILFCWSFFGIYEPIGSMWSHQSFKVNHSITFFMK